MSSSAGKNWLATGKFHQIRGSTGSGVLLKSFFFLTENIWIRAVKWTLTIWLMGQNLSWKSADKQSGLRKEERKQRTKNDSNGEFKCNNEDEGSSRRRSKRKKSLFMYSVYLSVCASDRGRQWGTGRGRKTARILKKNERNQKGTGPKQGHHLTSLV